MTTIENNARSPTFTRALARSQLRTALSRAGGRGLALLCLAAAPLLAAAADTRFPQREVTIVVPNEPGGGLDLVARLLAKAIAGPLERPVLVVNRSGASGNLGTASVARAEPDGHTLLLTGVGLLASPLLHGQAGYDPFKDFAPIARIAEAPNVMVVHHSLATLRLPQLLDDPRSRNGGFSYASAGYGQSSHLAAEVVMSRTGARWLHVPYRGTAPASKALMGGEVQIMFVPAGSVSTMVGGGLASALAVAHPKRLDVLPATPTLAELGVQGADFSQWYGLFAPSATPEPVVRQLQAAVAKWLADADSAKHLQSLALEPSFAGPAEFAAFLQVMANKLSFVKQSVERGSK